MSYIESEKFIISEKILAHFEFDSNILFYNWHYMHLISLNYDRIYNELDYNCLELDWILQVAWDDRFCDLVLHTVHQIELSKNVETGKAKH